MAFKGDLKDINLADIFQTLAMNQQEGTLAISSGDRHTEIYFNKDGVRLLASSDQKHIRLGELLLKMKKLTPVELDMALARQKMTGELLGRALVDMNVVTEDDINECVRKQIEEDIYEIFSWKKALFEFKPGEPLTDFFDPAKMGNPIAFNVNSVIMEAARRIDEWAYIHKSVPSLSIIYMIRDPQAAIPDISHLGFAGDDIIQIVQAVDGRSTVEDLVERTGLSKFESCKIMAGLVEAGYATRLDLKETVRIADGLYREGDKSGAIKIYCDSLNEHPSDTGLRLKLAELYESEDMKDESAGEYAKAAQVFLDAGARDDGFALFRKAVELAPKNFSIRQNLFNSYCTAQKFDLAAREGLFVAKTYWRMNRLEEARNTLEQILEMSPENVEALQMITSIYVEVEQPGLALEKYEELAQIFEKQGNTDKLSECYRKILVVAPKRGDIRNKLNSLMSKEKKAKRKGKSNRKLVYLIILILVAVAAGGAYYVLQELGVREKLAVLKHEAKTAIEKSQDKIDEDTEQHLRELLEDLVAFRKKHPYSYSIMTDKQTRSIISGLEGLIDKINKERTRIHLEKLEKNQDLYRKAEEAYKKGDLPAALKLFKDLNTELLGRSRTERVESKIREIKDYLGTAESLYKDAQAAMKSQDWAKMLEKMLKLVNEYPQWPEIGKVRLPLIIVSDPPGAQIRFIGGKVLVRLKMMPAKQKKILELLKPYKERKIIRLKEENLDLAEVIVNESDLDKLTNDLNEAGAQDVTVVREKTPYVLMREPNKLVRAEVIKRGYDTPPSQMARDQNWKLEFSLVKVYIWQKTHPGFIWATPVADGKQVYYGTRAGTVYALDLDSGVQAWSFTPSTIMKYFMASPMLNRGKLYIGSLDNNVYVLDTIKGEQLWSRQLGGAIWSSPSAPDNDGIFYIGCSDSHVYAINSKTQEIVWKYHTQDPVLSYPAYRNGVVYVGSNDKMVHAIDAQTGAKVWKEPFETRGSVTGKGAFYNFIDAEGEKKDILIIGSDDYSIYALNTARDLREGESRKVWSKRTGGAVSSSPFVYGDLVYFTSGDGKLYCLNAKDGSEKWSFTTKGSITSSPIVSEGVVYFGSSDSYFYAVSADKGAELWKYKTKGEIISGPCVSGKYIVVGSTDSHIYGFLKE